MKWRDGTHGKAKLKIFHMNFESNLKLVNKTCFNIAQESISAFNQIDLQKYSFWIAVGAILLSPTWWNLIARNEYKNKSLTRLFGSKQTACSVFSASVFLLGLMRDYLYLRAIKDQPRGFDAFPTLTLPEVVAFGYVISTIGSMFVLFSMHALGIHGTYLGDYFDILKSEKVTGFPFNVVEHPMYYGSTMCFLGTAIWYASPTGLLLTAWVLTVYLVAGVGFEEGFTNMIYSQAPQKKVQ